ncbi:Werner Syndrome-like exonuclease [Impatiens glandulifera]|uniref:Werner Syndrome-like exonuclease n=1 Tax=Impatiens glandulifera TaxID=253017 RepID=UPI001FB09C54|nr:Werner Syndrome-like exonuclease [Impatiens glandulifera]
MEVSIFDHELPFPTHNLYDVKFFEYTILTLVTHTPSFVDTWISEIQTIHRDRRPHQKLIVGLDIEWRPNFSSYNDNPAATLQLCVGDRCLIFQLIHAPSIPLSLIEFFKNPNHMFVGVGVDKDIEKLIDDYGFEVRGSICDLGKLAADRYNDRTVRNAGLKTLSARVLGKVVEKPKKVSLSRWDCEWLSVQQVQYACLDAFLSFEIGRILNDLN